MLIYKLETFPGPYGKSLEIFELGKTMVKFNFRKIYQIISWKRQK
jgi:hypothetical protein